MKTSKIYLFFFLSLALIISCSDDDNTNNEDPTDSTEQLIEALITDVTGGSESIWKIESATLTNSSVTDLDVSNTFNITDDEFVFKTVANSQSIALEHKQGNSFNENASDTNDFLLDFYQSSDNASLNISDVANKMFSSDSKAFTYNSNSSISAQFSFPGGASLSMDLSPKTSSDYASPPSSGLNFTEVATINQNFGIGIVGFTGANQNNSMYVAFRDGNISKVLKYDLNTNILTENILDPNSDFITKKALIVNNKLKVFGANYVTTYDLDIQNAPTFVNHNLNLTRFGFTTLNEDIYFVGGDIDLPANKIRVYNESTNNPQVVATLPTDKAWAASEIVDDKIYIFGGQRGFNPGAEVPETLSYIYNLEDNSVTTFDLPEPLFSSYAVRYQNLIYVAGNIPLDTDNNGSFDDYDNFFGVYNTTDDSLTEISTNLDTSGKNTVLGITIFKNKLYTLYGEEPPGTSGTPTKIMVADL